MSEDRERTESSKVGSRARSTGNTRMYVGLGRKASARAVAADSKASYGRTKENTFNAQSLSIIH